MEQPTPSRRQFLVASGNLASVGWITLNWPQIAAAAEHANHAAHDTAAAPTTLTTLNTAEAADVDAIANLIVPGGSTPGARDAHVVYFVDNALGSFFAAQLPYSARGWPNSSRATPRAPAPARRSLRRPRRSRSPGCAKPTRRRFSWRCGGSRCSA